MRPDGFAEAEIERFRRDGFLIARGLAPPAVCAALKAFAERELAAGTGPVEYEADVGYPGAPASRTAPGGMTVRRLLQAYARSPAVRQWAASPMLACRLQQLLGAPVMLSQAHHNCIMTKHPCHGSATGWHRDVRYWSFERPELVSAWLALGKEAPENGGLALLPGTHAMTLAPERLDEAQFLRPDAPANRALLASAVPAELEAGDVLFFHCLLFHAAGVNRTDEVKYSAVFTYRGADNRPVADTRSASLPEVALDCR